MSGGRIVEIRGGGAGREALQEAAALLEGGGLVAHPTETLYGLAVDPWSPRGLERLRRLKGRPAGGFILIAAHASQAAGLVAQPPPPHFLELARAFWPGALTLVVPPSEEAPRDAAGEAGGIALRVTPDPVAVALLEAFGRPLTSTSANRGGEEPASTAEEVLRRLGGEVDLILDGGPRRASRPSTLLDLTGPAPALLREGAVERARLRDVLGPVIE